jgi:sodium transport system permease protein
MTLLGAAWVVYAKEMRDALRDRRTLLVVLLSSVALGPALLFALSHLVEGMDRQAGERVAWIDGAEHGPSLVNHLRRHTVSVRTPPPDYEQRLQRQEFTQAVLVVDAGFEAALAAGRPASVVVVSTGVDARSQAGAARLRLWLAGFASEQATLRLAARGVAAALVQPLDIQERDLAEPAARSAGFAAMLPFFVVMAVLYGALHAALDSTAGERERGSLEPLMMNPAAPLALALGKWGAVATLALGIAVLSTLSFLPAQWWLGSEMLAAQLRFGPREAAWFVLLLTPLAAALAAALMAVAIRCRTFKEAQANASILLLVLSLLPLVSWLNHGAEAWWHLHVPVLAEVTLMNRVLRAEPLSAVDVVSTAAMAAAITVLSLAWVAARLRSAAIAAR